MSKGIASESHDEASRRLFGRVLYRRILNRNAELNKNRLFAESRISALLMSIEY